MYSTLPDDGLQLKGTETIPLPPDARDKRVTSWDVKGSPGDLTAIPKVAAVVRGQKSHLDGTASRKKERIQKYAWTLEPGPDCPGGASARTLEGPEHDVLLLCTTDVTLTVSDGTKEASAKTVATVRKRDWRTKIADPDGPYRLRSVGLVEGHLQFGDTACAVTEEGEADAAGHVLHREGSNVTWRGSTYELEEVRDGDSPFNGWFYVSENKSRYARRLRINRELYPDSSTGQENAAAHAGDLARIFSCTVRHEREHDRQMATRLRGSADPARKMESLLSKDESALRDKVDKEFRCLESKFAETSFFEKAVHDSLRSGDCNDPATIRIKQPSGDYQSHTFPHVADIGEGAVPRPPDSSTGCE
jgi:hypothetical protein